MEAGYSPDVGTFHDSQRERFGYLLSEMFVKQWNSVMKSADGKYDDKILELILTWQPFSSFLKILSKHQS